MCGIIGVWSPTTKEGLEVLLTGIKYLHRRGPEGQGAAFVNPFRGSIERHSANSESERRDFAVTVQRMAHSMRARFFLGQTRYITDERPADKGLLNANTQPMHLWYDGEHDLEEEAVGIHNGNIRQKEVLQREILAPAPSPATVDTRYLFEAYMQTRRAVGDEWNAAEMMMRKLLEIDGAASVGFSGGNNMIFWRDPQGYRPLWYGKVKESKVFVSETGFFDEASALFGGDNVTVGTQLQPGEMALVDREGNLERRVLVDITTMGRKPRPCGFEDIYVKHFLSLDESGQRTVRALRERIGAKNARFYAAEVAGIDFFVPAMNSGINYAQGAAWEMKKPYKDVLRKPMSNSEERFFLAIKTERLHRYIVDRTEVQGKSVGIVDDSIMRGDTVVEMYAAMKDTGANNVKFFIAWPPTMFDCHYGVDVKSAELLAHQLITKGIIVRNESGKVVYDITAMNVGVAELVREKVRERYGNKYGTVADLEVFYSPVSLVQENLSVSNACLDCITGGYQQGKLV